MQKILVSLFMLLPAAFSQNELSSSLNQSNYEPSYFGMFIGLLFVIGLIYLTGFLYKKLTKVKFDDSNNDKYNIQILSSVSLGQNKNLHVIEINNKHILIGATNNAITHIKDINEEDKIIKTEEKDA